jgi:hypothetical protein
MSAATQKVNASIGRSSFLLYFCGLRRRRRGRCFYSGLFAFFSVPHKANLKANKIHCGAERRDILSGYHCIAGLFCTPVCLSNLSAIFVAAAGDSVFNPPEPVLFRRPILGDFHVF